MPSHNKAMDCPKNSVFAEGRIIAIGLSGLVISCGKYIEDLPCYFEHDDRAILVKTPAGDPYFAAPNEDGLRTPTFPWLAKYLFNYRQGKAAKAPKPA